MSSSAITNGHVAWPSRSSRRRAVNLRLLLVTVVSISVIAAAMLFWYKYRRAQMATAFLDRAQQHEADQNWPDAVSYYQRSLLLSPDDTETLLRLVDVYGKQEQTAARR